MGSHKVVAGIKQRNEHKNTIHLKMLDIGQLPVLYMTRIHNNTQFVSQRPLLTILFPPTFSRIQMPWSRHRGCTHLGISKNKTEETENNLSTLLVFSHSNNDVEYLNIGGNIYDNNKRFQTYYLCCCSLVTKLCVTLLRPHGL